jgi:peptidyl-prolyl cis-trans isomerase C
VSRAMDLNQHLTDEVIRRRLVQVMSQLITASSGADLISESELEQAYEERKEEFIAPPRVSFSHVFLSDAPPAEAEEILEQVVGEGLTPREALNYGTAFLAGFDFRDARWNEVHSRFGREFAEALATLVEQDPSRRGWIGSIASVFGQHLIYLDAYQAERPQQLDEVVEQLRWDIRTLKEEEALDEVVNGMMASYEVRRQ